MKDKNTKKRAIKTFSQPKKRLPIELQSHFSDPYEWIILDFLYWRSNTQANRQWTCRVIHIQENTCLKRVETILKVLDKLSSLEIGITRIPFGIPQVRRCRDGLTKEKQQSYQYVFDATEFDNTLNDYKNCLSENGKMSIRKWIGVYPKTDRGSIRKRIGVYPKTDSISIIEVESTSNNEKEIVKVTNTGKESLDAISGKSDSYSDFNFNFNSGTTSSGSCQVVSFNDALTNLLNKIPDTLQDPVRGNQGSGDNDSKSSSILSIAEGIESMPQDTQDFTLMPLGIKKDIPSNASSSAVTAKSENDPFRFSGNFKVSPDFDVEKFASWIHKQGFIFDQMNHGMQQSIINNYVATYCKQSPQEELIYD